MTPLEQLSSACDDHATAQSASSKSTGLWPPARAFSRPLSGCERRSRAAIQRRAGRSSAPSDRHRVASGYEWFAGVARAGAEQRRTRLVLALAVAALATIEHGEADDDHERDKHEKNEYASRLAEGRVPLQISHPL
jgi:hypothetical protein